MKNACTQLTLTLTRVPGGLSGKHLYYDKKGQLKDLGYSRHAIWTPIKSNSSATPRSYCGRELSSFVSGGSQIDRSLICKILSMGKARHSEVSESQTAST